jgi:hypothetical protein
MIFVVYRQSEFNKILRRLGNADGEATTAYRKFTIIHEIAAILKAIRQLTVPPEKTRREIRPYVREKRARYRTNKGA